jgi:hypothetical protein
MKQGEPLLSPTGTIPQHQSEKVVVLVNMGCFLDKEPLQMLHERHAQALEHTPGRLIYPAARRLGAGHWPPLYERSFR